MCGAWTAASGGSSCTQPGLAVDEQRRAVRDRQGSHDRARPRSAGPSRARRSRREPWSSRGPRSLPPPAADLDAPPEPVSAPRRSARRASRRRRGRARRIKAVGRARRRPRRPAAIPLSICAPSACVVIAHPTRRRGRGSRSDALTGARVLCEICQRQVSLSQATVPAPGARICSNSGCPTSWAIAYFSALSP